MDDYNEYLISLHSQNYMPTAHIQFLEKLKVQGIEPKVIYDIGSCVCHWTNVAKKIWPEARYILFDAFDKVEYLYKKYDHEYHIGVLSNKDNSEVEFYQNDIHPTGNSYYKENTVYGYLYDHNKRKCLTQTLDTVVSERKFPLPDLIKIDVQGCEKDILEGAINTFKDAKWLIIEMQHTEYNKGAPLVTETLPYITSLGWKCVAPLFCNNGPDGDYFFERVVS